MKIRMMKPLAFAANLMVSLSVSGHANPVENSISPAHSAAINLAMHEIHSCAGHDDLLEIIGQKVTIDREAQGDERCVELSQVELSVLVSHREPSRLNQFPSVAMPIESTEVRVMSLECRGQTRPGVLSLGQCMYTCVEAQSLQR